MKQGIFACFLGIVLLLSACSSNATVPLPAPATVVPTETSIPTAVPSPTETLIPTITPLPTVTPTPAPTVTLDLSPTFPESGTLRSDHFTAALSQKWMDVASIAKIAIDPEALESARRAMLVHWASQLAQFSNDSRLKLFRGVDVPELKDLSESERLERVLAAYEQNAKLGNQGFQYEFDFGEGVKGKVIDINARAVATQAEWEAVISTVKTRAYITRLAKCRGGDMKSLIYFDEQGVFHAYTWDGNPYQSLPRLSTESTGWEVMADLFAGPMVNSEYVIRRTLSTKNEGCYSSAALWAALGCGAEECYRYGKTSGYLDITLKDGTRLIPSSK
jgi:hypothetical protein